MKNILWKTVFAIGLMGLGVFSLEAHFLVMTPDLDIVNEVSRPYDLKVIFTHPMRQGPVMNLDKPKQFGVMLNGQKTDLLSRLKPFQLEGKTAYAASYTFNTPGDYLFYVEPAPYWEPAEGKYIVQYSKVVVAVCGAESGWDQMVGFPVEIEPLTRPYSLYVGNVIQGIVKKNGRPVPLAEVEIEFYNSGRKYQAASESHVTQVIKADPNGVFTYSVFRPGWWGVAALVPGDKKMLSPDGQQEAEVELGAVMWFYIHEMKSAGSTVE